MTYRWKQIKLSTTICSFLVSSVIQTGCGGGSVASAIVAGIGGTGIGVGGTGIVFGPITGFGSVFVNGSRFETLNSQFIVDGNSAATQDDLALGMVVKLKAATENGVYIGDAIEVVYDDEIEGPIATVPVLSGTTKTFGIFGQTITIDEIGTVFNGTDFNSIDQNDVVEISGFRVSANEISATYVELKGTLVPGVTQVELRGTIQGLAGTPPNETFQVDGTNITTNAMTELDVPNGVLIDNLYVEVEGIIQADMSVNASKVEFEDDDFGDEADDVSLQGVVSNFVGIDDFEIDGQPIDASNAQLTPANAASLLQNGVEVEVEGDIVGGILIAEELEIEDGEAELRSYVSMVMPATGTFEVIYASLPGSVVVRVGAQTVFEDETDAVPQNFSIYQLNVNDFVRVEGREVNSEVVASVVKRTDPDSSLKLEGIVDGYDPGVSITVLGIEYGLGPGTTYNPSPPNIVVDDVVEIEDDDDPPTNPADGVADEVEEE
jgi:hypothetical protein